MSNKQSYRKDVKAGCHKLQQGRQVFFGSTPAQFLNKIGSRRLGTVHVFNDVISLLQHRPCLMHTTCVPWDNKPQAQTEAFPDPVSSEIWKFTQTRCICNSAWAAKQQHYTAHSQAAAAIILLAYRINPQYLSDVFLRVFPPKLIIFIIEAHERQHASGEQGIDVLLHVLPGG